MSLAAILLLGRSPALARWAPQHELVFIRYVSQTRYDVRHNLKGPILILLDRLRELLGAHLRISALEAPGFAELSVPDLTWWSAREAVLNALVHRDYFLHQSIYVELRRGRVEIVSPGGFIGGISAENILRHAPVRRNPLLADALDAAGFVNRAGMGVDRIYEELLRTGKGLPRYQADEASVRLVLPTDTHAAFVRLVADEIRGGRSLELDDLIGPYVTLAQEYEKARTLGELVQAGVLAPELLKAKWPFCNERLFWHQERALEIGREVHSEAGRRGRLDARVACRGAVRAATASA